MNKIAAILFLIFFGAFAVPKAGLAQVTANWTGGVSSDWNTAGNWSTGAVPGTSDTVKVGILPYARQPVIGANNQVAFILFGGSLPDTLTVNGSDTLRVSGCIMQAHNSDGAAPSTLLRGNGNIYCDSLIVGNNVLPRIVITKSSLLTSTVAQLNIEGNLVIRSSTIDQLSGGIAHNNSVFSLEGGELTVSGSIFLDNLIPPYLSSRPDIKPLAKFRININSSDNATLLLTGATPVVTKHNGCDTIDFYNHLSGTGKSTVIYGGSGQPVYTNNTAGLDTLPYTYQNLSVLGEGLMTAGASASGNTLNIGGDLNVAGDTLDLQSENAVCTVYGNYINRSVTNVGAHGITFKGPAFFNSGTFNYGTGLVTFSGQTQTLTDSTASGTNLRMVAFADTGAKHIHSGAFAIIPGGRVSLSDSVTVAVDTTGTFILRSDSTATAAITTIPGGAVFKGIVNAEWFVKGDLNSQYRGYRIISSPVNHTTKTDGTGYYNLDWLKGTNNYNGTLLIGTDSTANGFDLPITGGPTLYLFREDVNTNNSSFTGGNYRGVNKINYTDVNQIGTQQRFTLTPTPDTVVYLPIGNSVFFFFTGNRILSNGTTSGSKIHSPYNYPESVTFTNKGTINQGQVQVHLYYRGTSDYLDYTNSPDINNSSDRGRSFVGNPYPSAINWDNFSATDSTASIYGPGLNGIILIYNPVTEAFNSYTADSTHDRNKIYNGVGAATNIIASGEGFLVRIDPNSPNKLTASLRFRESAKFNPPDTSGGGLLMLKAARGADILSVVKPKPGANPRQNVVLSVPTRQSLGLKLLKGRTEVGRAEITFSVNNQTDDGPPLPPEPFGGLTQPALATYSATHNLVTANNLSLRPETTNIPLYVSVPHSGSYQLNLYALKGLSAGYHISLYDQLTKVTVDLRKNNKYQFNIAKVNKSGYGSRFTLIIKHNAK